MIFVGSSSPFSPCRVMGLWDEPFPVDGAQHPSGVSWGYAGCLQAPSPLLSHQPGDCRAVSKACLEELPTPSVVGTWLQRPAGWRGRALPSVLLPSYALRSPLEPCPPATSCAPVRLLIHLLPSVLAAGSGPGVPGHSSSLPELQCFISDSQLTRDAALHLGLGDMEEPTAALAASLHVVPQHSCVSGCSAGQPDFMAAGTDRGWGLGELVGHGRVGCSMGWDKPLCWEKG